MAKRDDHNDHEDGDESTIENRVYLFRELAAAFVSSQGALFSSTEPQDRARVRAGLAEIARVSAIVADLEDASPEELAQEIQRESAGAKGSE